MNFVPRAYKVSHRRLYKYLDVEGARLTLRTRTFKHAKPSDFNDCSDMTVERTFPEDDETAAALYKANFQEIILRNIDRAPTCGSEDDRKKVALIQTIYRQHPEFVQIAKQKTEEMKLTDIYDLDRLRKVRESVIADINRFLQAERVLCVSEKINSKKMWALYAQDHQGIALAIAPNMEKDSKYSLFRKVKYEEKRPCLYESAMSYFENSLFGDRGAETKRALDRVIYTKTKDWEYEQEYRLRIPMLEDSDWNAMPFHPEEIVDLYLGAEISTELKNECIGLAKTINPKINIYQCVIGSAEGVSFCLGE